jgi:hypothetical protein
MTCFAVFHQSKQLRVFAYQFNSFRDRERAKRLAHEMADQNHAAGYPCEVEEFGLSGVGCTVYRTVPLTTTGE